jgi:hypothetical protein
LQRIIDSGVASFQIGSITDRGLLVSLLSAASLTQSRARLCFDDRRNYLTHILDLNLLAVVIAQIQLQRASKQLQQHLKADLGNGRIVPSFAELIPNKRI